MYTFYTALEITGHETPVLVGLTGIINCSTHLNVSELKWYIKGFDDPVEHSTGSNSLLLSLNPDNTALNGTSVACRAIASSGEIYEETVTVMVKGTCFNVSVVHSYYCGIWLTECMYCVWLTASPDHLCTREFV